MVERFPGNRDDGGQLSTESAFCIFKFSPQSWPEFLLARVSAIYPSRDKTRLCRDDGTKNPKKNQYWRPRQGYLPAQWPAMCNEDEIRLKVL